MGFFMQPYLHGERMTSGKCRLCTYTVTRLTLSIVVCLSHVLWVVQIFEWIHPERHLNAYTLYHFHMRISIVMYSIENEQCAHSLCVSMIVTSQIYERFVYTRTFENQSKGCKCHTHPKKKQTTKHINTPAVKYHHD